MTTQPIQNIGVTGALPGVTVELSDNGNPVGSAIADQNGECTIADVDLTAGTNSIVATDETTGGSSSPVAFTLQPSITNSGGLPTTDQPIQNIGVVNTTPGAPVDLFDNGIPVGIATADQNGACTIADVDLAAGTNSFVATDEITGLSSSAVVLTFNPLTITNPGGPTTQSNQTITITDATPGAVVDLYDNGSRISSGTADQNGNLAVGVTLVANLAGGGTNTTVATDEATGGTSNPVVLDLLQSISWAKDVNGNWATARDWTSTVPTFFSSVTLPTLGTAAYVVASAGNVSVTNIAVGASETLNLTGGTFTTLNGTGAGSSAGTIKVGGAAALDIDGAFANAATGLISTLAAGALVDLSGGSLSGGAVRIVAGTTLAASGGANSTLSNASITDRGTIEAKDGTVLTLLDDTANAGGGVIESDASAVLLEATTITGGTLTTLDNGVIETVGGSGNASTLSRAAVSSGSTLSVVVGSTLLLAGTINNAGTIALGSTGDTVELAASTMGTRLNNNGVISGGGQIGTGDGTLMLVKDAIDATQGAALIIDTGNTLTNSGTLTATGAGGLVIDDAVKNTGTISSDGGNVTIAGNLTGSGSGNIAEIFSGNEIELQGVSNSGTIGFQNNSGDKGLLLLDHAAPFGTATGFKGTVAGFDFDGTHSDAIDLGDINFASGVTLTCKQRDSSVSPRKAPSRSLMETATGRASCCLGNTWRQANRSRSHRRRRRRPARVPDIA